ncbi:MAG: hypothetical protein ACREQ5_21550 [Candidatus Dormibacteria bacterium]
MTRNYILHDWREIARIVNLTHRFGCALERLDVKPDGERFRTAIELTGGDDALRRLDAQLTKLTEDDKEMAR